MGEISFDRSDARRLTNALGITIRSVFGENAHRKANEPKSYLVFPFRIEANQIIFDWKFVSGCIAMGVCLLCIAFWKSGIPLTIVHFVSQRTAWRVQGRTEFTSAEEKDIKIAVTIVWNHQIWWKHEQTSQSFLLHYISDNFSFIEEHRWHSVFIFIKK